MNKRISWIVAAVAVAFATVSVTKQASAAETGIADAPHHHLDWDAVDKTWRCVGSPIDCSRDVE